MATDKTKPLILIDGSSWLYRAFHALPPLTAPDGTATGAVYGMGNMLFKLLREYEPEHIAVVFDPRGKTFRHDIYKDYKANRPPTPPELADQFPLIRELLDGLGLPVLQIDGMEADDVIGTLALQAADKGQECLIVTGDKDMAQLVNEQINLLDTMKNKQLDREGVIDKFGVTPEQIIDYLALMGDSSDNIPGIPKVGPKTAAKWLGQYETLDGIIENAADIGGKIGETLREHLDQLPLSRELATIKTDVELSHRLDELVPGIRQDEALIEFCRRLGFTRWIDQFQTNDDVIGEAAPTPVEGEYATVLDEAAFDELVTALEQAELICVDTETDSLDFMQARLVGLSFAVEAGKAWYVPVAHDYMGAPDQLPMDKVLDRLRPILEDADKPKLGQHIKYDLHILRRHGINVKGVAYDSMLESYVYNSTASRHDMDSLAGHYLGRSTIKFEAVAGKGKKQLTFNQIDLEQAAPYAAEDADITLQLHQKVFGQLKEDNKLLSVFNDIEMPLVPVLADIEHTGVLLDTNLLATISAEMLEGMNAAEAKAHEIAGGPFNLNSTKQLQEILFEKLELPVIRKTPKGAPSTAEDVLQELADQHDLPKLILEYRSLTKLRSTYTESLPLCVDADTGRVHTSYHQAVAATGRLSSADPNLQNIPVRNEAGRRIRQAFVAPEGCALLAADYSQVELRIMAHLSEDERLIQAFTDGMDVHQATAAEVFGVKPDAVESNQRRAAKAINFGLIYGMSAFGLAKQLGIDRGEAQSYIDTFFERYPGVRNFMDETREQAKACGYVETLHGRRLYLPDINARNAQMRQYAERTAINAPMQGTAADLIKLAMIDLHQWLAESHPDIRMIMQVHDELVLEGPEQELRDSATEIIRRMEQVAELKVPLDADYAIGPNWDAAKG